MAFSLTFIIKEDLCRSSIVLKYKSKFRIFRSYLNLSCSSSSHNTSNRRSLTTSVYLLKDKVSSNIWLERQRRDIFVKQAGAENYRCRSAFKLKQINEKFSILCPGHIVIDCGSAPGSWCQVAVQEVNATGEDINKPKGTVIGVDLQYFSPVDGATILPQSDFTTEATQTKIKDLLCHQKADVLLSDMAPRATGLRSHNHEAIIELCFYVLRFSLVILKPEGTMLCKLWMGGDQSRFEKAMQTVFQHVRVVKPEASREDSAEIFLLGRKFTGIKN
ncbi:rRNA methyltransferase 2 mitochondrial [Biomphalaria glabrata]